MTNSVSQFSSGLFITAALEEERQTAFVQTRSLRHPKRRHIRDGNPAWVVSGEDYLDLLYCTSDKVKPSWGCIRPCTIVLSEKLKLQVRVLDRNVRYEKVQIYKYIVYGSPKEAEVVSLAASQQQGDLEPDEEES